MNDLVVRAEELRVLSLFSGTGMLDIGVKLAEPTARTVLYCEREISVCDILVSRIEERLLDDCPIWSDVTALDAVRWRGRVDIVIGSPPCQPASVAGRREGTSDDRWLWGHAVRVVAECQPQWAFFENVPGLVQGSLQMGFEAICNDLQGLGYQVAVGLFSSEEVGAPHKRERLFILARSPLADRGGQRRQQEPGGPPGNEEADGRTRRDTLESDSHHVSDGVREGLGLPDRPPLPDDFEGWKPVLEKAPWLAPALGSSSLLDGGEIPQSPVRGVADGLAALLGDRTNWIRTIGNGVDCLVVAYAYRSLQAMFD